MKAIMLGMVWGITVTLAVLAAGCGGGAGTGAPREVHVEVTSAGFVPATSVVPKGKPLVVVFTRKTDQTCGTDVVFEGLHRGYDLPLNTPVRVEFAATDVHDTLNYNCSMNMLKGMLVAK